MSGLIRGTFGGIRAWADLAGSLNEKAALWTAVTVVLGALGNLFAYARKSEWLHLGHIQQRPQLPSLSECHWFSGSKPGMPQRPGSM